MQAIDLLLTRRSARTLTEPGARCARRSSSSSPAPPVPRITDACDRGASCWCAVSARLRFGALLAAHLLRAHPGHRMRRALERERPKALRAPLIVVVAAHLDAGVKIPAVEQLLSSAAAADAMMLAAVALGFGAMWKTGSAAYDARAASGTGA